MLHLTRRDFVFYLTLLCLVQLSSGQTTPKPAFADHLLREGNRVAYGEWLLGKDQPRHEVEYQGYDGWYNNLARPDSGAIDRPLLRRSPAAYADGTYAPAGGNRPNPFDLSDQLLNGTIGSKSNTGKTAFLVFFGQQIVEEILDAQRPACPPEYFNIPIPEDHHYRTQHSHTQMPLLRTRFDHRTGHSPNNPRQQLNEITPYLDGGLMYGITKQWADQLRTYANGTIDPNGKLASSHGGLFPEYNTHRLPMANPPPPFHHAEFIEKHETLPVSRFFKLGNPRGNENTFLLTFGVLWFRWHNFLAEQIKRAQPELSSEAIFNEARKWVIATQQHIVIDEWLPAWLSKPLEKYKNYDASIDPQIDQYFQTAAFRFGHTLVPPGVYVRDYNRNNCSFSAKSFLGTNAVRTCNAFWRPQDALTAKVNKNELVDIDRLLMGMASQLCEKEDHEIVEDLRGNVFGPLEFPRRDLMAVNVQRGRDHGLPDFNTARRAYGLKPYTSFDDFKIITPEIKERLEYLYKNDINNIDTWIGGILETTATGPGELFETIILDQFRRIRDADRFWYENLENGLFTAEEVKRIKEITVYDIVMLVTKMDPIDIQQNVFRVPVTASQVAPACLKQFQTSSCSNTNVLNCFHLPILNADRLDEPCKQGTTFDYFSGSETSFIVTFTAVATFIVTLVSLAYMLMIWRSRSEKINIPAPSNGQIFVAKEITGPRTSPRAVFIALDKPKKWIQVTDPNDTLLRALDCKHGITWVSTTDKPALVIKAIHSYDLILMFKYVQLRENFLQYLMAFKAEIKCSGTEFTSKPYKVVMETVVTKQMRQADVERFFRVVYAQALNMQHNSKEMNMVDDTSLNLVETELTLYEFAEAMGMDAKSTFATNMFNLVDKDKNNFVSFREFIDFITTFSQGSGQDKARLLFNMYDINKNGTLSIETFKQLTGSLLGRALSEVNQNILYKSIDDILRSKNLHKKKELTFNDFLSIIDEDYDILNKVKVNLNIGKKTYKTSDQIVNDIYADVRRFGAQRQSEIKLLSEAVIQVNDSQSPTLQFVRYVERYSKEIFWATLYTLVLIVIFVERAYYYSFEREVGGLRQIAGYGVSITRGAASAMMFTYSSLLVTMCRNIITILRDTAASAYFPFDFCVDFHKYIAFLALGFTVLHIIGHSLNFYHISTQTADDLTCLFRNFFHATHEFPKFHYWCWGTITGVTGILLTLILAIMIVFAQTCVRRRLYNYFWYTHSLYPLYFILMVLHGTGQLVQSPIFYYFLLGPVILFAIDQCISISRKKTEIIIQDVKILPSNVTMLEITKPHGFTYKAGQWIRVACLGINAHEYHPFTLSSSPDQEFLSIHVRAVGPWTNALRQVFSNAQMEKQPFPKIYIDGPFGEGHQDWNKYEVSVLIASGIGVTPFASILKDIVFKANSRLLRGKKVYFLWVSRSQKQFEWLVDLLREIEEQDQNDVINLHLYITEFYEKYDLRTTLLYIFEKHYQKLNNKSMFTNLQAVTHFGRPNIPQFLNTVRTLHKNAKKFGVFSCGNPKMNMEVAASCNQINKSSADGIFEHFFEAF